MSDGLGLCAICTSTLYSHNMAALHCGHTFHFECINKWVESSQTCPICRVWTTPTQIIQHLYFTKADELDETQPGSTDASTVLEVLMLRDLVSSLESKLEDERKSYRERVPSLEARILQLEMMLVDQQYREAALRVAKNRLRTCELQLGDARKVQEKLMSDLRTERELVLSLRKKEEKLKTIVKTLNQELKDVRIASHMDGSSPFNPQLSSLKFEQSPLKRNSLGFNESVDIDTNVLSSALRSRPNGKPIRKRANATWAPNSSSDEENDHDLRDVGSSSHPPFVDSISHPQVPKSLRERVLTCSDNSRPTGLGGPQGPADMALANLELRHCTSSKAPIKNSVSKRKEHSDVVKNQRLSQFFPKMSKDVEVIDLE
ncbi:hypothetical protein KIN20_022306 [Parelaphostrongylus tenuis]|uniref:RING-type domain-containing protein n=1 Tax=Parelaphostrongylus tenuis TaxID=148309 RepID=A0AAD5MTV7_PARTN|nr:hypothetical protein KIN20_022306 [Parelaphostrongylus tenuis]